MADVKESELQQVDVAALIRCLDSIGNSKVITPVDLLFLIFGKGYIQGNTNCNDIINTGCYSLNWSKNTGNTNFPDNNYTFGALLVLSSNSNAVIQVIHNIDHLYIRIRYDSVWRAWKQIL